MNHAAIILSATDINFGGQTPRNDRLAGIANKVGENAKQLLGIRTHMHGFGDIFGKTQVMILCSKAFAFNHIHNDWRERNDRQCRAWLFGFAKSQRAFA